MQSKVEAKTAKRKNHSRTIDEGIEFHKRARLVEQQREPTRCALISPDIYKLSQKRDENLRRSEFDGLARAINLDIIFSETVQIREVKPATYVGGGFVELLAERVEEADIELVLFNCSLSPVQQRNLEQR